MRRACRRLLQQMRSPMQHVHFFVNPSPESGDSRACRCYARTQLKEHESRSIPLALPCRPRSRSQRRPKPSTGSPREWMPPPGHLVQGPAASATGTLGRRTSSTVPRASSEPGHRSSRWISHFASLRRVGEGGPPAVTPVATPGASAVPPLCNRLAPELVCSCLNRSGRRAESSIRRRCRPEASPP
jgi:hypothetical protein